MAKKIKLVIEIELDSDRNPILDKFHGSIKIEGCDCGKPIHEYNTEIRDMQTKILCMTLGSKVKDEARMNHIKNN